MTSGSGLEVLAPWTFRHGASWLVEDGRVIPIPGFHDEWIHTHQELVPGCSNVCDVVLRRRWVSVSVFSEGYVELLLPGRNESETLERSRQFLVRASDRWSYALLMTMDEEGYVRLEPKDASDPEEFLGRFRKKSGETRS